MKKKIVRITNKSAFILAVTVLVSLCLFVLMAFVTNVSTTLEVNDIEVFKNDLDIMELQHPQTFDDEIVAIKTIQQRVFAKAPPNIGSIPLDEPREPSDLMRAAMGLCYDRSRTLDKAFEFVGLQSRHVYLLYRNNRVFWSAIFLGKHSHAVSEG